MTDGNPKLAKQVQEVFNEIVFAARENDKLVQAPLWNKLAVLFGLDPIDRGFNINLSKILGIPHHQMSRYRLGRIGPKTRTLLIMAKALTLKCKSEITIPYNSNPNQGLSNQTILDLLDIVKDFAPQDSVAIENQAGEIIINPRVAKGLTAVKLDMISLLPKKHGIVNVAFSTTENCDGVVIRPTRKATTEPPQ